jgi:hypothetical protein
MLPTPAVAIWCQTPSYRLFAVRRPWSAKSSAWRPRGENVDLDAFGRAASHLRRLFESIGIDGKQRDLTLDPQAYFYENS